MSEKIYKCPLCKKSLTQEEYSVVLQLDKARAVALKKEIVEAKKQSFDAGVKQNESQVNLLTKQYAKALDTIEHLKRGDTAQKAGYAEEDRLIEGLQKEFPDDEIQKHGKKGDVLQIVNYDGSSAGKIVYECKRMATLLKAHIKQTYTALQYRKANYAILVTVATRTDKHGDKAFDSLLYDEEYGIYIVRPLGVMALVTLLRDAMIFMHKSNLSPAQRLDANRKLSDYLTRGEGSMAINTIIHQTTQLRNGLMDEMHRHDIDFNERWKSIYHIGVSVVVISQNIGLILSGQEPTILNLKTPPALPLPAPELPQGELTDGSDSPA